MEKKYQVEIQYQDFAFTKYKNLNFDKLLVVSTTNFDTLLFVNSMNVVLGYNKTGFLKPYPVDFRLNELLVKTTALPSKEIGNEDDIALPTQSDVTAKLGKLLRTFHHYFPENFKVNKILIISLHDDQYAEYQIDDMCIAGELLSGKITLRENKQPSTWLLAGNISTDRTKIEGILTCQESDPQPFLFCKRLWDMDLSFREMAFSYCLSEGSGQFLEFNVQAEMKKISFFQPELVEQKISIDNLALHGTAKLMPNLLLMNPPSSIVLNGFSVPFSFSIETLSGSKNVNFRILKNDFAFQEFRKVLPEHLFRVIPNLDITGEVESGLQLECNFAMPDQLIFNFDLSSKNLRFSDSARYFFTKYNQDFHYKYKENGEIMKDIWVSPANDQFVSFDQIPFYMKYAILVAEDPSFFRHHGFLKSAMQESMALNLERGSFARGGSTLSMQLVKNLFLTKKKMLSRKVEEIFLVWLIEYNHLISKERMFEIYVNIIEWGPNVYGLGEASQFYFNKPPDRLTFGECVYLATLIRSPKHYTRSLTPDGYPTDQRREEMHLIARRMYERGLVTEVQYGTFNSYIRIELTANNE
ncbi:MAG: transglycosylase domain-containing protein [Bacteroidales bacterium]|nr:transglycosylase domain-containing protein [Bacteroidales bacterium]